MTSLLIKGEKNHSKLISTCFFIAEFLFRSSAEFVLESNKSNSIVYQKIKKLLEEKYFSGQKNIKDEQKKQLFDECSRNEVLNKKKLFKSKKMRASIEKMRLESQNLIYLNFINASTNNFGDLEFKMHLHPCSRAKLGDVNQTSILQINLYLELDCLAKKIMLGCTQSKVEMEVANFISTGIVVGRAIDKRIGL